MKKLFIILLSIVSISVSWATNDSINYKIVNNVISVNKTVTTNVKTGFLWEDSKGNQYPIYVSSNKKLFVYKISSKTGNTYKYYLKLPVHIQDDILNSVK